MRGNKIGKSVNKRGGGRKVKTRLNQLQKDVPVDDNFIVTTHQGSVVKVPELSLQEKHAIYLYAIGEPPKACMEGAGLKYISETKRNTFRELFLKDAAQAYLNELYEEQKNSQLMNICQMQIELIKRLKGASDRDAVNMIKLIAQLQGNISDDAKVAININWGSPDMFEEKVGEVIEAEYIDNSENIEKEDEDGKH